MLETILYNYLNSTLSVPAYMERPENPPEKFIIIERTGGSRPNQHKKATIAIRTVAPTLYEAASLGDTVCDVMEGAVELAEIGGVRNVSFYNFTHRNRADREEYCYQAVFEISNY